MIQVPLMKTINFATKADISDRFCSGNIREIVNTFSYSCEKMCMHKLCSSSGVVGRERMGTAFPHKRLSGNGVPTREFLRDIFSLLLLNYRRVVSQNS